MSDHLAFYMTEDAGNKTVNLKTYALALNWFGPHRHLIDNLTDLVTHQAFTKDVSDSAGAVQALEKAAAGTYMLRLSSEPVRIFCAQPLGVFWFESSEFKGRTSHPHSL